MAKVDVGTKIKDNDPRGGTKRGVGTITGFPHGLSTIAVVYWEGTKKTTQIRVDRIYTEGPPRRTGYSVVVETE